jgi:hypothetical protein
VMIFRHGVYIVFTKKYRVSAHVVPIPGPDKLATGLCLRGDLLSSAGKASQSSTVALCRWAWTRKRPRPWATAEDPRPVPAPSLRPQLPHRRGNGESSGWVYAGFLLFRGTCFSIILTIV